MHIDPQTLPVGLGGLRYGISQVSLAVHDLDTLVRVYHEAFGWAPWKVFDHVEPMHHNTERQGRPVPYSLRGAEVQVGSLNFELLQPLEGPNVWMDFIEERGEGIASIATMFLKRPEGDTVKEVFKKEFDADVILRAEIGDHIEYYYLDTAETFGMLIESGSGHAIDFVSPTYEHPDAMATMGPAPATGAMCPITAVTAVVRNLEAKVDAFGRAFGWGPWTVEVRETTVDSGARKARIRVAATTVGDMRFELLEPVDPSPWQNFLTERGEGLCSVAVGVTSASDLEATVRHLESAGGRIVARSGAGTDTEWILVDAQDTLKCWFRIGLR